MTPSGLGGNARRAALGLGGIAVAASLTWALWPLPAAPTFDTSLAPPAPVEHEEQGAMGFDRSAFAARIWNPRPAPEAAPPVAAAPKPAPPPRLQLIGIVHDTAENGSPLIRAALYDPDTDRLHIVASGERIGAVTITLVDAKGVEIESAGRTSRLALREPERAVSDLPPGLRGVGTGMSGGGK
ncbi:MAG: hypothetical protein IPJ41_16965 [Phycisphaerales bacterium]|nr:hypothetical protein [Phycisphaerales bacterium]